MPDSCLILNSTLSICSGSKIGILNSGIPLTICFRNSSKSSLNRSSTLVKVFITLSTVLPNSPMPPLTKPVGKRHRDLMMVCKWFYLYILFRWIFNSIYIYFYWKKKLKIWRFLWLQDNHSWKYNEVTWNIWIGNIKRNVWVCSDIIYFS